MPCDYRILQSPIKEQVKLVLWETVQRSLLCKSLKVKNYIYRGERASVLPKVKTSAKFVQTTAEVSRKYYIITNLSTRTH